MSTSTVFPAAHTELDPLQEILQELWQRAGSSLSKTNHVMLGFVELPFSIFTATVLHDEERSMSNAVA